MKIGDRIFVHGYIDEIRKDTVIIRNNGGYFGTIPSEVITGEVPSIQSQQWIPCSERLPEIEELVLVTDDSGGVKTVDVDRCGQYECSEKRFWYYTQNVVAWMPLPEPYQAERMKGEG